MKDKQIIGTEQRRAYDVGFEAGREEGIEEANQVWVNIVKYASGDTLQTVIDEGVEATERLKEKV